MEINIGTAEEPDLKATAKLAKKCRADGNIEGAEYYEGVIKFYKTKDNPDVETVPHPSTVKGVPRREG